jgi:hypothetical protein
VRRVADGLTVSVPVLLVSATAGAGLDGDGARLSDALPFGWLG